MFTDELISEVSSEERLYTLVNLLRKIEIDQSLFNLKSNNVSIEDINYLAEAAALLSLSKDFEHRKIALTIATILPQVCDSDGVISSSIITLNRLANFPTIPLISNAPSETDYKETLSSFTSLEAFIKERANSVKLLGKHHALTDFQRKVVSLVDAKNAVSISAPTSAGKSYVYLRLLLQIISERPGTAAIYIVPTRALIRQVMDDIYKNIKEFKLNGLQVSCSSDIEGIIDHKERSTILVLTQERLYQLCTSVNAKRLSTQIIVVDEAQNIASNDRGVLFEGAVKYAITLWPKAKILFSSPLVDNPEKLLEVFNLGMQGYEKDIFPVVRQNVIIAKRGNKKLFVSEYVNGEEKLINVIQFFPRTDVVYRTLTDITLTLWNNQYSIVYANDAMTSAKVARGLFASGSFKEKNEPRLEEFAQFIEEHIHKKYELADFIRHGIAFHFGYLPAVIRAGIEDLFKDGLLDVVCCTSTLLEGVNMPAKNIFIFRPTQGRDNSMDELNFWNLSGRAGRMGKDLSGNIICIEPDSWEKNPFIKPKLREIRPATEKKLQDETMDVLKFITNRERESLNDSFNEHIVSMLVREKIQFNKNLIESPYVTNENRVILEQIDSIVDDIISDFKAPKEIILENPGILPDRINELWKFFSSHNFYLLMPAFPFDQGAIGTLRRIITIINSEVLKGKYSEKQIFRLAAIAQQWMTGSPLSEIVLYGLDSNAKKEKITSYVKDQVKTIEYDIRFVLVKYMQLYTQLLKLYLISIDKKPEAEKVRQIYTYLEYGACTVPPLTFMSLGLSRAAAVELGKYIKNKPDITQEDCISWFSKVDIGYLNIQSYLKSQIIDVQNSLRYE